jgi:hypothetical protein
MKRALVEKLMKNALRSWQGEHCHYYPWTDTTLESVYGSVTLKISRFVGNPENSQRMISDRTAVFVSNHGEIWQMKVRIPSGEIVGAELHGKAERIN